MNWKEENTEKITVKQAAEKWNVSLRRVQDLCKRGEIIGAERWGRSWMIPKNAPYPQKGDKSGAFGPSLPMPKKSPFLDMTNLYHTAGCYNDTVKLLESNPEAQALFEAEIAYSRGEIDKVYLHARHFLDNHSGFYAVVSAGMLLALCSMWTGDVEMWKRAKIHIAEAPCKDEHDREIVELVLACVEGSIFSVNTYPEWFKQGKFSRLPSDSHPAARVFYGKYLYALAYAIASGRVAFEDINPLNVSQIIDKRYIADDGVTRQFYSNYWDNSVPDHPDYITTNVGFVPSVQNERYYYTEDALNAEFVNVYEGVKKEEPP